MNDLVAKESVSMTVTLEVPCPPVQLVHSLSLFLVICIF